MSEGLFSVKIKQHSIKNIYSMKGNFESEMFVRKLF